MVKAYNLTHSHMRPNDENIAFVVLSAATIGIGAWIDHSGDDDIESDAPMDESGVRA